MDETAPAPARPAGAHLRDRRRAILASAARLFHEQGFEATSLQQVAEACGLTKAGLYHHIRSKEDLLVEIIQSGLDVFEAEVVAPALRLADPVARLRAWMQRHLRLINQPGYREATIIIHERLRLPGPARARVRERQRRLVHLLQRCVEDAMSAQRVRGVNPRVAAFGMLGMVLWTSRWYRPNGPLSCEQLAQEMCELFLHGLVVPARVAPSGWADVTPGWLASRAVQES